jgi:putative membrane protein
MAKSADKLEYPGKPFELPGKPDTGRAVVIARSLAGLPAFVTYFALATALCVLYVVAYVQATPHREFHLIVVERNASAAAALGMSLFGFSFPLASAIYHSSGILDCAIWGIVGLAGQLVAYALARWAYPNLSAALKQNTMSAALWLGFVSLTAGLLSAACMSY